MLEISAVMLPRKQVAFIDTVLKTTPVFHGWRCPWTDYFNHNLESYFTLNYITTHTHTRLTALFLGLPRWAGTRKVKPIWISLKQYTVSGSGTSWAICKSAPRSRQITTPAHHHSVFYRPDLTETYTHTQTDRPHWEVKPNEYAKVKWENSSVLN